ncbi:uncharacterized protein LOC116852026 [Odontomachus brunneus]|uniref:uncharacterized protein LOC116852026 n=1 Tax=Odontomachus brunneus TaxID=486640 RepID=UPI0013F18FEF|nr:uncharacterized protein LOC116852026 [Odontomachus brunneus]
MITPGSAIRKTLQIVILGGDTEELLLYLSYTMVTFTYMFIGNYIGQRIIMTTCSYNVQWHKALLHMQKIILFLLQRGNKTFSLSVGGLVTVSLETFVSVHYRLEQSIQVNVQHNINVEDVIMIYNKIVCAINIHRKAMMICTLMMKEFEGIYCIIIVILVCGMSLNLYQIFQIISFENDRAKIFMHFGYVIAILLYLFMSNYSAQQITDHNNDVYAAVYNTRWYVAPLHIQKLVLLLLQRGNKPFYLTIGKVFVASLEGFATLTSLSMSYFTVIYSTQQ